MSWLTIDVACETEGCGYATDHLVKRDGAPAIGDAAGVCPLCRAQTFRVPSRLNVTRASYVDGTRRFDRLRAQDRLDKAYHDSKTTEDRKKVLVEKVKLGDTTK